MTPYCCLKNLTVIKKKRKKEIKYLTGKQRLWVHPLFSPKSKGPMRLETSFFLGRPHWCSEDHIRLWLFMLSRGRGLFAKLWLMCWLDTLWCEKGLVGVAPHSCTFARLLNELWGWTLLLRTLRYCWVWYDLFSTLDLASCFFAFSASSCVQAWHTGDAKC